MELFLLGICAQKDAQGLWYLHDAAGPRKKAKTIANNYSTLRGTDETWRLLEKRGYVTVDSALYYNSVTRFDITLTKQGMAALISRVLKENEGTDPNFFVHVAEDAILDNAEAIKRYIR